jgi:hypothetical protein
MPNDPHFPDPEPGPDEAVRAHLDAEAARTDPHAVWDRVRARLEADAAPAPARRSWKRWALYAVAAAGLAAAVLVALTYFTPTREAVASPADVVRAARAAHGQGIDRCYTQTVIFPPEVRAKFPLVADGNRNAIVCTRGNQLVVEPGLGGWGAWGRDEHGRVWVAPTPDAAARFDENEVPPALREAATIRGLELHTLLDHVLIDFDLDWSGTTGVPDSGPYQLVASRRGTAQPFQVTWATLIIERDTNLVHTLVLVRVLPGGSTATVTFQLNATVQKDPAAYTAEGHVRPGAPIYDARHPIARRLFLLKSLGEASNRGQ